MTDNTSLGLYEAHTSIRQGNEAHTAALRNAGIVFQDVVLRKKEKGK